ncbi:glycosyltransferase [Hyphobacterium sp.]|uniref:glycosyltransferase n=1 Tax=Hyphobacterium sp. TaxID=2004662 RepID=UPI003BA9AE00
MSDALRVLHGPVNIGNQPWAMSRAERKLGLKSDLAITYNTWINYPNDICLSEEYGDKSEETLRRRQDFLDDLPHDYDVFHYYFGRTFSCWDDYGPRDESWFTDLDRVRFLGKKAVMTLQGCDIRMAGKSDQRNAFTACRQGECGAFEACVSTYDAERQWLADNVLPKLSTYFYLNPELGFYSQGGHFLPYSSVDWRDFEPKPPQKTGRMKILHGPSDPAMKGTRYITEALDQLKDEFDFELILVTGKPYDEAMALYGQADVVIDQVLHGWYGGFAVELMSMGKPVMCYLREEDFDHLPGNMRHEIGTLQARPDHLVEDLRAVLGQREKWPDWSDQALEYAKTWHDPQIIAKAMIECYTTPDSVFDLPKHVEAAKADRALKTA